MQKFVYRFKALLLALALPFALWQTANAQLLCDVDVVYQQSPGNNLVYFGAVTLGDSSCFSQNSTFTWSFGDGSSGTGQYPTHTYNQPGWYGVCVSATRANGQVVTDCDTIIINDTIINSCNGSVNFSFNQVSGANGTFQFYNTSDFSIAQCISGNSGFIWSFGDGTGDQTAGPAGTTHTYANPGTYVVCLKTFSAQGQPLEVCQTVVYSNGISNIYIGGMILADNSCLQSWVRVELIGLNNNTYKVDSIYGGADSCYYNFSVQTTPGAPSESYIIRATPLINTDYLSTYFGDAIFWSDATVLQPTQNQWNLTINLVPAANIAPGLGLLTGTINGNGATVTTTFNGNPITTTFDVTASRVIILNAQGQPVGFAFANADGTFSFPNLPEGNYQMRVDNPKVPSQSVPFSITGSASSVNVTMNTTASGITTVTSNSKTLKGSALSAFPNPATETISLSGVSGSVEILNAKGQIVMKSSDVKNINISNLSSGLYTIKGLNDRQETVTTRFVKK
jgi:hypothetical protein